MITRDGLCDVSAGIQDLRKVDGSEYWCRRERYLGNGYYPAEETPKERALASWYAAKRRCRCGKKGMRYEVYEHEQGEQVEVIICPYCQRVTTYADDMGKEGVS